MAGRGACEFCGSGMQKTFQYRNGMVMHWRCLNVRSHYYYFGPGLSMWANKSACPTSFLDTPIPSWLWT